jgi:hypothetical protein
MTAAPHRDVWAGKDDVFGPIGHCIYCGGDGGGALTREHVNPRGLGGGLILRAAVCKPCQETIHAVETTCMQKTLLPYRRFIGLVNHPNNLPATLPLLLDWELKGPTRVALDKHPDVVVLPGLRELPGILIGHSPTQKIEFEYKIFGALTIVEDLRRKFQQQTHVGINLDGYSWVRMLAKIAHGYAVAQPGFDGFSPLLPDLILGRKPTLASHLVGKCPVPPPIPEKPPSVMIEPRVVSTGEQRFFAVNLRLFTELGPETPIYTVIAGCSLTRG